MAGCAYIFYLTMTFFLHKASKVNENATKLTFRDGVVSQALNVKGAPIVILMYSQFLISDNAILPQVIKLSIMLATLNLFTHFSWGWEAHGLYLNLRLDVQ